MTGTAPLPCERRQADELLDAEWCETHRCFWEPWKGPNGEYLTTPSTRCPMAVLLDKFEAVRARVAAAKEVYYGSDYYDGMCMGLDWVLQLLDNPETEETP